MKKLLFLVLILAFLLRFIKIDSYPIGFTPDEASFGYDAYSLLNTGKDQWGQSWPLTLRSFGDFKLPLYVYLTVPSVAVFGLNEFSTRLPNAILGSLAIFFVYLMVKEMFAGRKDVNDGKLALVSSFLLAISPWHISLSRGAFEANLTTFIIPVAVWMFYKGIRSRKWMVFAALAFGMNLFSYHSARFFTPILIALLIFLNYQKLELKSWSRTAIKFKWAIITFSIFIIMALYSMGSGAGDRGADIAIFNPTDGWGAVSNRRYEADLSGLPDIASRLFSNKISFVFDQFINSYVSYISPQFLFTQGAGEWTYGMIPGRGVLYLIEVPFILISLWSLFKKRSLKDPLMLIVLWLLIAPIPAALTKGPGFAANRAAVMMPALQIFSAYGAVLLLRLIDKFEKKRLAVFLYTLAFVVSFGFFLEDYLYHAPRGASRSMLYGRKDAIEYVKSIEGRYDKVIISRSLSEPQIYAAFYTKYDPSEYQKSTKDWLRYKDERRSFIDQLGEYGFGKYSFGDINYLKTGVEKVLLVGKLDEFPKGTNTLKVVQYPDNQPAFVIVDPRAPNNILKTN